MAQVLRTFWEGGAVGSTPNTPPHQGTMRLAPTTVLTAHNAATPKLRSGTSPTLSPARSNTVTPMSSTSSSIPSPLPRTTIASSRSGGSSVSPGSSAGIGQLNPNSQPKPGSVVSTSSLRPSASSSAFPMHSSKSTPPIPEVRPGYCPPCTSTDSGAQPKPISQSIRSVPTGSLFSKEDAFNEIDGLDCTNESVVLAFYEKCMAHGHNTVALAAIETAFDEVLRKNTDPTLVNQLLFDGMAKQDRLRAYGTLSQTCTNPGLLMRHAIRAGNDYLKKGTPAGATNAESFYQIAVNLTAKPGLGSFKLEYEAKLVEAQREKARLSATSSPMPKSSAPPSTFSSSSGQPPLRTAPTPPMPGGMVSTPPKAVPGRFPVSAPGPMSTSVPSSRPAPLPPPQGSFSAPPSDISVRPSFCQSSSSSSTPTPTSLAVTPITSPTPRLLTLHEYVSDLQRRPGLPGIDFLTAEDIKNSRHLVLEVIRSSAHDPAHYNQANDAMREIIASFVEDQRRLNNDFWKKDDYILTRSIRGGYFHRIAEVLAKYQTNTDHAWLTLFHSAAACNSVGEHLDCPRKQKHWHCDHFVFNRFAIQRKLGFDNKLWTQDYCQRISPFVDPKWKIQDTYEEADRKGNLYVCTTVAGGSSEAAARDARGLHHYRMMGTNSIQYGGYSNV